MPVGISERNLVFHLRFSQFVPVPGPRSGTAMYRGLRPNGTTFYQSAFPFFLNGKRPSLTTVNSAKDFLLSIFLFVLSTHYPRVNSSIANWIALYYWAPTEFFERKPNVLSAFINRNENCVLQTQLSLTR